MQGYRAFGLTFSSDIPLEGWFSQSEFSEPDFSIRLASGFSRPPRSSDPRRGIYCLDADEKRCTLSWSGVAEVIVDSGKAIDILPVADADQEALRLFISGAAVGVLLHQRGYLVLHGSAVDIERGAAAFIGPKGSGKSTTAIALQNAGHRVISEELVALVPEAGGNSFVVLPSGCPVKVWGRVASAVEGTYGPLVPVRQGVDKYFVPPLSSDQSPAVVRQVYLLDVGDAIEIKRVAPIERFLHIAANLYVQRFGTEFVQAVGASHAFKQIATLVKGTAVLRLVRTNNLDQLRELSRFIASSFGCAEYQSAL